MNYFMILWINIENMIKLNMKIQRMHDGGELT